MERVLATYRAWKTARQAYRNAFRVDGEKGTIVRRALRELIVARAAVRRAIEDARDCKVPSCN